jgi:hypothetical protein
MDTSSNDRFPPELQEVGDRLRASRPALTPLEAEDLKLRLKRRAGLGSANKRGSFMKSRLALTFVLVSGLLLTGGGGAVAVTGIAGDGNSGTAQYQTVGGQQGSGGSNGGQGGGSGGQVLGKSEQPAAPGAAQAGQQVASSGDDSLPFTGLLAIPMLAAGVGLLGAGAVMRRGAAG